MAALNFCVNPAPDTSPGKNLCSLKMQ